MAAPRCTGPHAMSEPSPAGAPAPDTAASAAEYARFRPLLWLVSLAIFMQMLDSTIVNTALP